VDLEALASSPVGRLVAINGVDGRTGKTYNHKAFLPDLLPADLELEQETYRAVTEATAAVARLDEAACRLPNPSLLARPAIRREAVSTSALEGTYAAFTDVLEGELLGEGDRTAAVAEVVNYVKAAEHAFSWIESYPISLGLLGDLQKTLVAGTRGETSDAGRIRKIQVYIGGGGTIETARFVPPPPGDQLQAGIEAWLEWINRDDKFPLMVKMALGHYQFETLHPFADGNGRLGRLVCVLQLGWRRELRVPVLNLSPWLEQHRTTYQDHLLRCSTTGQFDEWIRFFCQAVHAQSIGAIEKIDALHAWKEETVGRLKSAKVRGVAVNIAADLIGYPVITPTLAAKIHKVTYQAANSAIKRLADLGILQERTGRPYARLFAAPGVLRIIDS
jgi:Fic family protein